jgi:Alpha-kinase family
MAYPTLPTMFHTLTKLSRTFDATKECTDLKMVTLLYDPHAKPIYGTFKSALFGQLDEPILGDATSVVIKQCWYKANGTGNHVVLDNHTQVVKLTAEINCLRWASALMGLVYNFTTSFIREHSPPRFSIPNMRFVKSALAIADKTHDTYLLEEVIDDSTDGFIKYIGNGSAQPLDFLEGEEVHRVMFLSFCQHVQYLKTKSLTFVSDFQGRTSLSTLMSNRNSSEFSSRTGGKCLLTDPQIITLSYVPKS